MIECLKGVRLRGGREPNVCWDRNKRDTRTQKVMKARIECGRRDAIGQLVVAVIMKGSIETWFWREPLGPSSLARKQKLKKARAHKNRRRELRTSQTRELRT